MRARLVMHTAPYGRLPPCAMALLPTWPFMDPRRTAGIEDTNTFHQLCRVLMRTKANFQLAEIIASPSYNEWIQNVSRLTYTAFRFWRVCRATFHVRRGEGGRGGEGISFDAVGLFLLGVGDIARSLSAQLNPVLTWHLFGVWHRGLRVHAVVGEQSLLPADAVVAHRPDGAVLHDAQPSCPMGGGRP